MNGQESFANEKNSLFVPGDISNCFVSRYYIFYRFIMLENIGTFMARNIQPPFLRVML